MVQVTLICKACCYVRFRDCEVMAGVAPGHSVWNLKCEQVEHYETSGIWTGCGSVDVGLMCGLRVVSWMIVALERFA